MFKKNDTNLRKDFRKLLQLTNEQFQSKINSYEQRTYVLMWNKIVGENGCITVLRFQKQTYRLGVKITTSKTKDGYMHEIINIAEKGALSKLPGVQTGDIILEVNGVNLLLLNYDQLALTLGGLPNNIQFVLWKKEGEGVYEKPDNFDVTSIDDQYHFDSDNSWRTSIKLIVQCNQQKSHGLEFIDSTHRSKNSSRCVIQKINKDGYFSVDRRISVNDSIVELNRTDLRDFSEREMRKTFSNIKRCAVMINIRKHMHIGSQSEATSIYSSKFSIGFNSKESLQRIPSTPNMCLNSLSRSMRLTKRKPSNLKGQLKSGTTSLTSNDHEILDISIDPSGDIKMFLVDIQEAGTKKCVIYGFDPHSALRKKFRFKDQIIKINNDNVIEMSSKDVGLLLKRNFLAKIPMTISVFRRGSRDILKSNESIIAPSEMLTTESETASRNYNRSSRYIAQTLLDDDTLFNVTLCKTDDSFGLRIFDQEGPTITEIIPGSVADKCGLVKVADKIIRINDIYVMDKEEDFVLKMIRSCGEKINIELIRKSAHESDLQFIENQTYFSNQTLDSITSDKGYDSNNSVFYPLPPVPENDLTNDYNANRK